uniref:Uncharacterized protein n=1 Tax=Arundo donax TaxID=35708 RepID=A0A0A8ZCX6_ARUDO
MPLSADEKQEAYDDRPHHSEKSDVVDRHQFKAVHADAFVKMVVLLY